MALVFPENRDLYKGMVNFQVVIGAQNSTGEEGGGGGAEQLGGTCEIYLPAGMQIADKVEYENAQMGVIGAALAGGTGGNAEGKALGESSLAETAKQAVTQTVAKFSERASQVARARSLTAPNPNTRALFKQVSLRQFQFTFKLIPTTQSEAQSIPDIIKFFRTEMYPTNIAYSDLSLGYKFPNKFRISFDQSLSVTKISDCYLEAFQTNYNPSNAAFLQKGDGSIHFSETDISLTFMEAKTLSKDDIKEGF